MAGGQRQQRLNKSCILLIAIAGIERFAFKGVASNLVTYLTDVVNLSNSSAAKMVNSWVGFTSIMPLLVAPIADAYWHKYSTIMVSSFLYFVGLVALTTTALARSWHHRNRTMSSSFLSLSLYLISLGQGGYNPSLQAFGADQLGEEEELPCSKDDKSYNKKTLFFQWWYFGVCSGSLLGVTVMSYIQDTFGWVLGFAIPAISMIMSILIFSGGSPIYLYKQHEVLEAKKPIMNIFQTIKASALRCFHCEITLPNDKSEVLELELQEKPLCPENLESLKDLNDDSRSGMYLLKNVKVMVRLLPIWTMLLMFAVIFQQPATFFTKQGMTMKRNIGADFKIPPATLQSAITLSIILLMPLYDKIFIPIAQVITRQDKGISVMQRMGIGMVLSIIAMVIAALVETRRLEIGRQMRSAGLHSEWEKHKPIFLCLFWFSLSFFLHLQEKIMGSTNLGLSSTLLLLLVGFATSDINQDKADCTDKLVGLVGCLPYVGGGASAPTMDCCSGLKQVIDKNKRCLCVLIKDRDDPSLGLKINVTLALKLPDVCKTPTNITQCVDLLHLQPNSPDAKVFEGFEKALTNKTSPSSGPSGSATGQPSSGASKNYGGWGKKWVVTEVVCGILPIVFVSHLVLLMV